MKAIILAGGKGVRLWPLSRNMTPKQVLDLGDGQSMLKRTLERILKNFSPKDVIISTGQPLLEQVDQLTQPYQDLQTVAEPACRNTAGAICLSLKYLLEKEGCSENEFCLVCPSDLHFSDEQAFFSLLEAAETAAMDHAIVTFGVKPTFPETSYGYIQVEPSPENTIHTVAAFKEKPDLKTAQQFIDAGNYYWNSGVFVFQIGYFLQELRRIAPEFANWMDQPYQKCLETFSNLQAISFDYAIMEKTSKISLIPYEHGWSDLGSWERLYQFFPKDETGNVTKGEVEISETEKSLIFSGTRKVVVAGLDNLVLVDTKDVLLVAKMGADIKALAEKSGSETQDYESATCILAPGEETKEDSGHWIVVKGTVSCNYSDTATIVTCNQSFFVPEGEELTLKNHGEEDAKLLCIQVYHQPILAEINS